MNHTTERSAGFTLVEMLVAMVIIGIAVSSLVLALGTLSSATVTQSSSAVADTVAHNYAEAVAQKVQYETTLSTAVTAGQTQITLTSGGFLGFQSQPQFDILVDQEVMLVKSHTGDTLTVTRGVAGSDAAAHTPTARDVTQYFVCPAASSVPSGSRAGYLAPEGFAPPTNATASIAEVDYWNPSTQTFSSDPSTCLNYFSTSGPCALASGSYLPECNPGLERIDIRVQTKFSATDVSQNNSQNVSTDTWTLVRRGSSG
jgi:prepilin-type N-terminal cleavage/methylation domain-containing protein